MSILTPQTAAPRCDATVRLLSRRQRPYLFEVIVQGLPPHAFRYVYNVTAPNEKEAAFTAIGHFCKSLINPAIAAELAPLGTGKLQ
jgi:hypothetical protein